MSVDHRRAGLRAGFESGNLLLFIRVSRSSARWPARVRHLCPPFAVMYVSVDHRRAGLRAATFCWPSPRSVRCQSIIGALACARASATKSLFTFIGCQSIIGALACARWCNRPFPMPPSVSVDHRRAGLRAGRPKRLPITDALVSVDHRRAGLRASVSYEAGGL